MVESPPSPHYRDGRYCRRLLCHQARREISIGTVESEVTEGLATVTNPLKGFLTADMVAQTSASLVIRKNDYRVRVSVFTGGLAAAFIRHFSVEGLDGR